MALGRVQLTDACVETHEVAALRSGWCPCASASSSPAVPRQQTKAPTDAPARGETPKIIVVQIGGLDQQNWYLEAGEMQRESKV